MWPVTRLLNRVNYRVKFQNYVWECYINCVFMNEWLNGCFYDRMKSISMKKYWALHEFKRKKKLKLKTKMTSHELYKPVDQLGLPNNLVDRLIGGIMNFTTVWIDRANQLTIYSTVRNPSKRSNNKVTDWLCQCEPISF
jgi:hypothetical protein